MISQTRLSTSKTRIEHFSTGNNNNNNYFVPVSPQPNFQSMYNVIVEQVTTVSQQEMERRSLSSFHTDVLLLIMEQQRRIQYLEEELQKVHDYLKNLQTYIKELEAKKERSNQEKQSRYWTQEEHQKFLIAIEMYGKKDLKNIAKYVGSRSIAQVRTHAQKYFAKIDKELKKQREQQLESVYKITDAEGNVI
jgi:SHAQKYF class myb-like DNA-binding protein